MGCEKQPLAASRSSKPQLDSAVCSTRVTMQPRTNTCIGAKNRSRTATSVTEMTTNVDINRQQNPATDVAIPHPKKQNRDHCPSHTWQAWKLTSTRLLAKPSQVQTQATKARRPTVRSHPLFRRGTEVFQVDLKDF